MARDMFENPFTNDWSSGISPASETIEPAQPRSLLRQADDPSDLLPMQTPLDSVPDAGEGVPVIDPEVKPFESPWAGQNLLSDPKDVEKGPTAFQRKEINWSDGNPDSPKAVDDTGADFLEVDYQYGRKEGASDKPVLAANIFGRQFTADQLNADDEGRKLLELMQYRRSGKVNEGGALSRFAKGFGAWSVSDIPFYGWVSDIGASCGDAIDMSKTFRKLQDGEAVTPHEAMQVRRFMLQQEIEGQRSVAYNVGAVTRQAIGFMAEMYATSLAGAAVGAVFGGGIGAIPGAIVGAALTPLKWAFGFGRKAAAAGARKVVNEGMAKIAAKAAGDITAAEFVDVARAGMQMYGGSGYRKLIRETAAKVAANPAFAAKGLAAKETRRLIAQELSTARALQSPGRIAARTMMSADYRISLEEGMRQGLRRKLLESAGADLSKPMTLRETDRIVSQQLAKVMKNPGEWESYVKGVKSGMIGDFSKLGGKRTLNELARAGIADTAGQWVSPQYASQIVDIVAENVAKNFALRYGGRAFSRPERLARYMGEHLMRGLVQTDHSINGMGPTLAHGGLSSFYRCMDGFKEGFGRVFLEAPMRAAVQLGVSAPLGPIFAAASGHDPLDVTYKGQLGFMANALVTGDRENMDSARPVAIGSMFVEYMSENAGAGLAPMLGGLIGKGASLARLGNGTTAALDTARKRVFTPITKKAGAILDRAVAATFGENPFKEGSAKLVGAGVAAVTKWARAAKTQVAENEVRRVFAQKSLDGISNQFRSLLLKSGIRTYSGFKYAVCNDAVRGGRLQALRAFVGATLLERGATPDRIVQLFRQSGYDGILEEMGEERLGDFVRGLFHLDDTASDATVKDHIKSAFSGFTDPDQLLTEAIGFAIPGGIRRAAIGSQKWLAGGALGQVRDRAQSLMTICSNPRGTVTSYIETDRATAEAVAEHERRGVELKDAALGTSESNRAAMESNADALFERVSAEGGKDAVIAEVKAAGGLSSGDGPVGAAEEGLVAELLSAQSAEDMRARIDEYANQILTEAGSSEARLERELAVRGAETLLGKEGADAIRREWRRIDGNEFSDGSAIEASLSEYKAHMANVPRATANVSVADAANTMYAAMTSHRRNASLSRDAEDRAARGGTAALVDENIRATAVEDAIEVIRYLGRAENRIEAKMGLGRRVLSRAIGFLGAAATGDLSLAAANPAMWLAQDAGIDKNLLVGGLYAYNAGLLQGFRSLNAERYAGLKSLIGEVKTAAELQAKLSDLAASGRLPQDAYDAIEEAGRETFERRTERFVTDFLAMHGVMLTTAQDADEMAKRVVATRLRELGENPDAAAMDAYFAGHPEEVAKARAEVVDGVLALARDAIGFNTHPIAGEDRCVVTVDVAEAVKRVSSKEVLAAILDSPAYRGVAKVRNVSGLVEHERETVLSSVDADVADLSRIASVDADGDISERDIDEIAQVMRMDVTDYTPDEVQELARTYVRRAKLLLENVNTTWRRQTASGEEVARIVPIGGGRVAVRVTRADGTYDETEFDSREAAAADLSSGDAPFSADEVKVAVSNLRNVSSEDATSALFFRLGEDRDEVRRRIIESWGAAWPNDESMLPPSCRNKEDGTPLYADADGNFDAAAAARQFRRELALAKSFREGADRSNEAAKACASVYGVEGKDNVGYEARAEKILLDLGIRRNSGMSTDLVNASVASDAWVVPVDAVTRDNTVVLSTDYMTLGNGEAMLRMAVRNAIWSYVSGSQEAESRHALLAYAFRRFREVGEEYARSLEADPKNGRERAKRIRFALDETFPVKGASGVTTSELAAMASSSVFFSCDRGASGEGNGFLRSTEISQVADRFRADPIFPLFASAVDEALGGHGFFHASSVSSTNGIGRYVPAFAAKPADLVEARKSGVFGGRNPFISAIRFMTSTSEDGRTTVVTDRIEADPTVGVDDGGSRRVAAFDGMPSYLQAVARPCVTMADAWQAEKGGTDTVLTSAQVFEMARRAGMFGGMTADEELAEADAAADVGTRALYDSSGRKVETPVTPAAKAALDRETGRLVPAGTMTPEVREAFGAALRMTAASMGADRGDFYDRAKESLLDLGMPFSQVQDVMEAYENAFVKVETVEDAAAEANAAADEANAAAEDAERQESTNDPDHEVRTAEFTTSQDMKSLSGLMRWMMPDCNGNVSASVIQIRRELTGGRILTEEAVASAGLTDAQKALVADLIRSMNPYSDLSRFGESMASTLFASTDPHAVERAIDATVAVLAKAGHMRLAVALSAVRNIPDRNGRRSKILNLLSQATPVDPMQLERDEVGGAFSVARLGSRSPAHVVRNVVSASYMTLLDAPALSGLFRGGKPGDTLPLAKLLVGLRKGVTTGTLGKSLEAPTVNVRRAGSKHVTDRDVAMSKEDYLTLMSVAYRGMKDAEFRSAFGADRPQLSSLEFSAVLDRVQTAIRERMAKAADVIDRMVGPGTTIAYVLRAGHALSTLRTDAEAAFSGRADDVQAKAAMEALVTMSNYFVSSAKGTTKTRFADRIVVGSSFLQDVLAEPLEGLALRLTGKKTASFFEAGKGLPADAAEKLAAELSEGLAKTNRIGVRRILSHMGFMKVKTQMHLDRGITAKESFADLGYSVKEGEYRSRGGLEVLVGSHFRGLPRSAATLGGRSANAAEAAKDRSPVTLPSMLPGFVRFANSALAKSAGVQKELLENGNMWADGSNPVCAFVGAKDADGTLLPKETLAGLVNNAVKAEFANGEPLRYYIPFFRADKPSCYALQLPARIVKVLVTAAQGNPELAKSLPPRVAEALSKAAAPAEKTGSWKVDKTGLSGTRLEYREKDEAKFNYLGGVTKMIAFGRPGSTTDRYGTKDFKSVAVDGSGTTKYTSDDVVGISLNGGDLSKPGTVMLSDERYQRELSNAVKAGATIIADNPFHRNRSHNVAQEGRLADSLKRHGYEEEVREFGSIWRPKGRAKAADTKGLYDAAYALAATMLGQSEIDPKRIPVISSVGAFVSSYVADADGNSGPRAGLHVVSRIGGTTGASLMGGYNLWGVLPKRISALCNGDWSEAQKLHMFNVMSGVNFKKGQATARDFRKYIMGQTRVTNGAIRESLADMCREIERVAGLKKGVLSPLVEKGESQDQAEYDAYVAELEAAVLGAEKVLEFATFMGDDLETNKAGLLGSSCGIVPTGDSLELDGVTVATNDGGEWRFVVPGFGFDMGEAFKGGKFLIAPALAALTVATGKEVDAAKLKARWRRPDGTEFEGTLADSGLLAEGETLKFEPVEGRPEANMRFFTRAMHAQLVASNANSSKASSNHVFPTNATRDHWMVESIRNAVLGTDERRFLDAHASYSLLQLADLAHNPSLWRNRVLRDTELRDLLASHPNDNDVRDAVSARMRSFMEKQTIVGFYGNHGIMVPSGAKVVEGNEFNHTVKIEWASGMTGYDRDCYRPAEVYETAKARFYGCSRGWASGSVNVAKSVKGFRYGLYLDEAALDAIASDIPVADGLARRWARAEGCDVSDARLALKVVGYLERWQDDPSKQRAILGAFTDYTGRKASESAYAKECRFDDLWYTDASGERKFDLSAIGIGDAGRRWTPDNKKQAIYLAGSPFHAHRSPSGNIQAACGTVRATCPYEFDGKTGEAGPESKYALDPVTTVNQGSDMDGDSASLQFYDYSAGYSVSERDVRDFTDAVLRGEDAWAWAKAHGWTKTVDGEEHIDPGVLAQLSRQVFTAQCDNYREMPTLHQGWCDGAILPNWKEGADGSLFADFYAANTPTDGSVFADYGFTGRHPVGTDAVFPEPFDAASLDFVLGALPEDLANKLRETGKFEIGRPMNKALEAAVDVIRGPADMSLVVPDSAAGTSDAASDSAKARGISVANQSLFLRALVEGLHEKGLMTADVTTWREDSRYSPVADLIAHFDGVSNNLFDTLKKMFATRAGWTTTLLPMFLGRLVVRTDSLAKDDPDFRVDSKYVLREAIMFLSAAANPRSVIGAVSRFADPAHGRDETLAGARKLAGQPSSDGSFWLGGRKLTGRSSHRDLIEAVVRSTLPEEDRNDVRSMTPEEKSVRAAAVLAGLDMARKDVSNGISLYVEVAKALDTAKGLGRVTDYMKTAGRDLGTIASHVDWYRKARTWPEKIDGMRKAADALEAAAKKANVGNRTKMRAEAERLRESALSLERRMRLRDDLSSTPDLMLQRLVVDRFARQAYADSDSSEELSVVIDGTVPAEGRATDFAQGQALRENFDRMVHLVGALKACDPKTVDALCAETIEVQGEVDLKTGKRGPSSKTTIRSTRALVTAIADAMRRISDKAAFSADENESSPLMRFLASVQVDGAEISLLGRQTSSDIALLREGFDQLASSDMKFDLGATEVTGAELAKLLVLHASLTRPFGATTDYVSQSNIPAVFGDQRLRDLEAWRPAILSDENLVLALGVPPVRIGGVECYDLFSGLPRRVTKEAAEAAFERATGRKPGKADRDAVSRIRNRGDEVAGIIRDAAMPANGRDPFAELVERARDPLAESVSVDSLEADDGTIVVRSPAALPAESKVTTYLATSTVFLGPDASPLNVFPVPTLREDGGYEIRPDADRVESPEEAYNRFCEAYEKSLDPTGRRYSDCMTAYRLNGKPLHMRSPGQRRAILAKIIGDAASRSTSVYDTLAKGAGKVIQYDGADTGLVLAINSVVNDMVDDRISRAPTSKPENTEGRDEIRSAYGAGVTNDPSDSFEARVNRMFPGEFSEKDRKSSVEAIRQAFTRVFDIADEYDSIDVSVATDGNGNETNLVKVTRTLQGRDIVTYVRLGATPAPASSDRAVAESLAEFLKATRGTDVTADQLMALGPDNLMRLGRMMSRCGFQKGSSVPGSTLDFAPAMSGVIDLSANADFRTLFHEYYHQMVACFRGLGILDAATESAINEELGGEEVAADRYAAYLTGIDNGTDDVELRKFLEISEGTADVFSRFRSAAKDIADMTYRGKGADGLPVFMTAVIYLGDVTEAQASRITRPSADELASVETMLLGRDSEGSDALVTPDSISDMRSTLGKVLDDLADGNVRKAQVKMIAYRTRSAKPVSVVREEAPVPEAARRPETLTPTGRVSAFIRTALTRYSRDGGTPELEDAVREYAKTAVDSMPMVGPNAGLFYNVRRFIRYVAEAEGIATTDEDGKLTKEAEELLSNESVAELAMRLINNATAEREEVYGDSNRDEHSGADWTLVRALETIAPSSYGAFARNAAKRSADAFLRAARALSAKGDAASREAAREFTSKADQIVRYADAIARGEDIRHLIPGANERPGQPYGLLIKMFTGSAGFGGSERHYTGDGVLHYDIESVHANVLSVGDSAIDPIVTAAYDAAAQALFTALSGRNYRAQMQGAASKDEGGEDMPQPAPEGVGETAATEADPETLAAVEAALAEGSGIESGAAAQAAREADLRPINESRPFGAVPEDFLEKVDVDHTSPDFILADPGRWLASDMQRNLMGIPLRDMMTDHTIQALCESKYRMASDWIQFFGLDTHVGDGVRKLDFVESRLGRDAKGDFAISDDYAHTAMRFSQTNGALFGIFNWQEKRVGEAFTERDWQNAQYCGQLVKALAMRSREILTGVRVGSYANAEDLANLSGDWETTYSPAKVRERKVAGTMTALDVMLDQLLEGQLGDIVLGGDTGRSLDSFTKVPSVGLYGEVVRTIADATAANRGKTPGRIAAAVEDALCRAGLAHAGAGKTVISVSTKRATAAWQASDAFRKLVAAGRPRQMLNPYLWGARFARHVRELNDAASRSSFIASGVGSNLSLAGSRCFWFHGGTGSHVAAASKYRNAVEMLDGMRPSDATEIERKHAELFDIVRHVGDPRKLRQKAFDGHGNFRVTDSSLRYLAFLMGLTDRTETKFDVRRFAREIAAGFYERASYRGSKMTIDRDATVLDVYCKISEAVTNETFDELMRDKEMPAQRRQELLDRQAAADILAERLKATVPGAVLATDEVAEFDRSGRLGDSRTAAESLVQMCRDLTAAERFRGCLAQMLTSLSSDGTPAYLIDPDDAMVAVNKMPDEYWGALARNQIRFLRTRFNGVPAYDPSLSGVQNARAVFAWASADKAAKEAYGALDVDKYRARGMFNGILCRLDGNDAAGNVNFLTAAQGGEAACYMKQLLGTLRAPTTEAAWRWFDRITSWSKISSVGFSAFFQIATAFESPVAAVGFTKTFLGQQNLLGKALSKAYHALGHETPLINDLVGLINSNDPFMTEARELCDLVGMPLDQALDFQNDPDDSNPVLGNSVGVKRDIERVSAAASMLNAGFGKAVRKAMEFGYKHPTDYTFNVVLNGVKMAVVMQMMRRLREECLAGGRPFDPVREMKRYARYLNAEIGGIDPARYAWATPGMRRLLSQTMFSWQWTLGAWSAGGGEAISDILFGGHSSSPEIRRHALLRWVRMLGIVKFGVPMALQLVIKAFSMVMRNVLPPPPDGEEDELAKEIEDMPWLAVNNESKAGMLSFDVTPLLKLAARVPVVRALKEADVPVVSAIVPAYVGGGRNTTGKRRYYMHFGKQSDEFFRWFEDPLSQILSKSSIPLQKTAEGIWGSLTPNGFRKAFADKSFIDRWTDLSFDSDQSALWNLISGLGKSFSWESVSSNPDAGFLAAVGPMRMGQSKRSTRLRIVERLKELAEDDRSNNPYSYAKNRRKLNLLCTDILREGQLNGVDPTDIMTSAIGDVVKAEYLKLFDAMPKDLKGTPDVTKMQEAVRALARMNRTFSNIKQNVVQKFKDAGTDVKRDRAFYKASTDLIRSTLGSPLLFTDDAAGKRYEAVYTLVDRYVRSTRLDDKGGENLGNFLATDDVPETLFGVPIVTQDYTTTDLEFFEAHPEAGGFYELGDEPPEPPEPPDGTEPPEPPRGPTNGAMRGDRVARRRSAKATDPMLDMLAVDPIRVSRVSDSVRADEKGGEFSDRANAAVAETIDFLRTHEGFRPDAYRDTEGVPTIGYGQTNILDRAVTMDDRGMSEPEARKWMEGRVRENAVNLYKRHPWMQKLSTGALAAAYDLAYNMGDGIFMKANSPGFNRRLAAGEDPETVFWSELPTYVGGKDADAQTRKGLMNRRNDAIRRWKK